MLCAQSKLAYKVVFQFRLFIDLFLRFFSHIPPNQGGKYAGFGYSREPPPKSQSQELLDSTVSSLASSLSWLSAGAAKIASTAKDSASRYGNIASQKVIFESESVLCVS